MNCAEVRHNLHAYVDSELAPAATLELEAHLVDCTECRLEFEALLASVETVRGAGGLYDASPDSHERARLVISRHHARRRWTRAAVAAAIFVLIGGLYATVHERLGPRDRLAAFAAEEHLRYARGAMQLDIRSDQPSTVAGWLSDRLPFRLTLPNYPEPEGETKKYTLTGARLLQLGDEDVAYLAYRMGGRPISLLMASSARIVPAGGAVYSSGGIAFHTTTQKGLRIITWTDKDLSYALVSQLEASGAESCMICHGGSAGRKNLAPLRPTL